MYQKKVSLKNRDGWATTKTVHFPETKTELFEMFSLSDVLAMVHQQQTQNARTQMRLKLRDSEVGED